MRKVFGRMSRLILDFFQNLKNFFNRKRKLSGDLECVQEEEVFVVWDKDFQKKTDLFRWFKEKYGTGPFRVVSVQIDKSRYEFVKDKEIVKTYTLQTNTGDNFDVSGALITTVHSQEGGSRKCSKTERTHQIK